MTNSLFYDFIVDKENYTILVKREFLAPLPIVWDAWTKQEIIDRWWAPTGWKSVSKFMEFKVGSHRHYVMNGPEGEEFWGLTTYASISEHIDFAGDENFSDEHATIRKEHLQSKYKIKFMERGNKTFIEHQTTYTSLKDLESSIGYGFEKGTLECYARLDEILSQ